MKLTTISALTNSLTLSLLIPAALVVATADGSIVKRDALHTTPTFTSPFLGDRFRANPRSKNLDDQVLVTKLGGTRRLSKIQLWCSDDTIFSMQPWYHGHGYDVQHWQYADNRNGGRYKEFLIKDTEYISIVRYDFCGTPGHVRLCYLYLSKDPVPGHPGDSGSIDCGHVRHDSEPSTHWFGQTGDYANVGDRGLLSFAGTVIGDKIIGLQTNWIGMANYLPPN